MRRSVPGAAHQAASRRAPLRPARSTSTTVMPRTRPASSPSKPSTSTPKARTPPSSWAAWLRSTSGHCGQGFEAGRLRGGSG